MVINYILPYQDYQDKCTCYLKNCPQWLQVEDTDYSIELSQSYNGNLHLPVMNESVPFVMPLDSASQQSQQETFNLFVALYLSLLSRMV